MELKPFVAFELQTISAPKVDFQGQIRPVLFIIYNQLI